MVGSLVLALALQTQGGVLHIQHYPDLDGVADRLMTRWTDAKLDTPKVDPTHKWVFEYVVGAYGKLPGDTTNQFNLRFRVFNQQRKAENDFSEPVARLCLKLWDYNAHTLRLDHSEDFAKLVDVYIAWGGKAGGEQMFAEDEENNRPRKANIIYVYDLKSFSGPLEMVREVAHEYGHATLAPIGRYERPETWANGYLGERLYLRWMLQAMKKGKLSSADALGATPEMLSAYVAQKVTPLVQKIAFNGPDFALLKGESEAAMNEYMGLVLYAQQILPAKAFSRSMLLTQSTHATDYPNAILDAIGEIERYDFTVPPEWKGKTVFMPIGKGMVSGGKVVSKKGGWAKITLTGAKLSFFQTVPK